MKKIFLPAVLIIFTVSSLHAQSFKKGTNVLSGLIGIGSSLGYFGSQSPGLSVNFERGAWQAGSSGVISIGGYAGRKSFSYDGAYGLDDTYSQKWSYTIIGVRSAYHYTGFKNEKLDVYGGLMLSYNILSYSVKYSDENVGNITGSGSYGSAAGLTGYLGGRYYFNPKVAANVELGYGVSYLNAGVSLKF